MVKSRGECCMCQAHADRVLPRLSSWAALLIVLSAFAVRLVGLEAQSLWYDEGYSVQLSRTQSFVQIAQVTAQQDLNTPLHYWMLKAWMLGAGWSEFAVRLLSVFGSVLGVALGWKLGQQLLGRGGWVSALLLALSPANLIVAQEARTYAWLGTAFLATSLALLVAQRSLQVRYWGVWGVLALITMGLHVLGALVVGVMALGVLWQHWRVRAARLSAIGVLAAGAALVLALLPYRASYGVSFDAPADVHLVAVGALAAQVLPRALPQAWVVPSAASVGLMLVVLGVWSARDLRRRVVVLLFVVNLAALVAFFAWSGKFSARHPLVVQPLFTVLVGVMLQSALKGWIGRGILAMLVMLSALGVLAVRQSPAYANEDFRGAVQYVRAALQPDERLILVSGHFAPVVDYYWDPDASQRVALPDDPVLNVAHALTYEETVPMLNAALGGKGGAWLLLWQDDVIDPTGLVPELLRRQAVALGPRALITQFHGLRLLHYRFFQPYRLLPERIPASPAQIVVNRAEVGLSNLGCTLPMPVRAGAPWMEVWCFWQIKPFRPLDVNTQVSLRVFDAEGSLRAQQDQAIAPRGLPYFPYEKPIFAPYFLMLPADLLPGAYTLHLVPYTAAGEIAPQVMLTFTVLPRD